MDLDLPLGDPGLTLSDIEPRLYSGLSRISLGGPTLTDLNGIDYLLAGLPNGPGELTLTYAHPPGAGFAPPRFGTPPSPTPQAIIIPLRESTADSLTLQILKNGFPWTGGSPVLTYLGTLSEPGDWAVSGWPDARPGERWALRYSIGGVHGMERWEVPAIGRPGLAEWELADYAYVASIFPETWQPTAAADPFPANWLKIVPEGQAITLPAPEAKPVGNMPTLFAVRGMVYDRLLGDLEGEQAPVRFGRLVLAAFLQGGARTGPLLLLRRALLLALDAAAPGPISFDLQAAIPRVYRTVSDGYWREDLIVSFNGG